MDYIRLGSAGLQVSRICLGMMSYGTEAERAWHLDEAAAEPIVKAAADGGITFFDTADTYSGGVSEEITGRLLGPAAVAHHAQADPGDLQPGRAQLHAVHGRVLSVVSRVFPDE